MPERLDGFCGTRSRSQTIRDGGRSLGQGEKGQASSTISEGLWGQGKGPKPRQRMSCWNRPRGTTGICSRAWARPSRLRLILLRRPGTVGLRPSSGAVTARPQAWAVSHDVWVYERGWLCLGLRGRCSRRSLARGRGAGTGRPTGEGEPGKLPAKEGSDGFTTADRSDAHPGPP